MSIKKVKRKYYVNFSSATSTSNIKHTKYNDLYRYTYTHAHTHVNSFEYITMKFDLNSFGLNYENFFGWNWLMVCFATQMFMLQLFHIAMKLWIYYNIYKYKQCPKYTCYKATKQQHNHHHHHRGRHLKLKPFVSYTTFLSFWNKINSRFISRWDHSGGGAIKFLN